MKDVTKYESNSGKLFETKIGAENEDFIYEIVEYLKGCDDLYFGSTSSPREIINILLGKYKISLK